MTNHLMQIGTLYFKGELLTIENKYDDAHCLKFK